MNPLGPGAPARGTTSGRPVMVLLDALGRRGALRILWELRGDRQLTFRGLLDACDSNPAALNTRLKELRALGLVTHEPGGYRVTAHGESLTVVLGPLNDWADAWASDRAVDQSEE